MPQDPAIDHSFKSSQGGFRQGEAKMKKWSQLVISRLADGDQEGDAYSVSHEMGGGAPNSISSSATRASLAVSSENVDELQHLEVEPGEAEPEDSLAYLFVASFRPPTPSKNVFKIQFVIKGLNGRLGSRV
ncbi:hypothetical protein FRB96_004948 [Tulasnella sp. 330]|nr:hypothetical protein FRB96_004948 [Tulasnella sp. 330]